MSKKNTNTFVTGTLIHEVDSEDNKSINLDEVVQEEIQVELTEAQKQAALEEELDVNHVKSAGKPKCPIEYTSKGMVDIARIIAGGSFGANALKCGKPRLSTTKCITRCHLLVLNVVDWKTSEKAIVKRELIEKCAFIKSIPIFSKLSQTYL